MEGRKISQKYNARGSQVGDLLNPVRGYRDTLVRRGVMPRDHARDNARQLREMQANNRVRKQQQQEAARHTKKFTMKQFRGVQSRFRDGGGAASVAGAANGGSASPRSQATHNYVRKGQGRGGTPSKKTRGPRGAGRSENRSTGGAGAGGGGAGRRGGGARKAALPAQAGVIAPRSNVNFVRQNLADADTSAPPVRASGGGGGAGGRGSGGVGKRDYGKVPAYLKERRAELEAAAEERRRNMPDEDCPPGMTLLPEEERVSTLAILTKSLAECKKQLGGMPLLIETHGQRKRQEALDDKMRELEEAIKIFGRDKVFVREDE